MTAQDASQTSVDRSLKMSSKRKKKLEALGFLFLLMGLLWLLYWLGWGRFNIYTDNAYVTGNLVQLMPQVAGTITSINTDDTQFVLQGQLLIKLDETDYLVALQKSRADLALTVREVRQYYENVEQATAILQLRKSNLEKTKLDLKRRVGLVDERAISREELQHSTTALAAAEAEYYDAWHKLVSANALVENAYLYDHPLVKRAATNFAIAYLNWVRTRIYAPVSGFIAKRHAQVGQQVNMGTALLAIVPLNEIWVDANYKESQINRLRIGQKVELIADANNFLYHGKLVGLSPGTGSVFTLLPPQNATGNWIKIVQRIPVRIALDPNEVAKHPLQLGLSMRATTFTRWLKGKRLNKATSDKPIYTTPIYDKQLLYANQEIEQILSENAPNLYQKKLVLQRESDHG